MKSNPVQDYILKSKQNLLIASAVGEAWPSVRAKMVSGFIDRLDARLKKNLKGWQTAREDSGFFVSAYAGYYVAKRTWGDSYWIGFQCNEYGDKMVLGVARSEPNSRKWPLTNELLAAVLKIHPSAKALSWWEAQIPMRSPAPDWRKPEVLWSMHKEQRFLSDVAEQILEIAEVIEPAIDRILRRRSKGR
jgi:hypothetical protein